MPNEAVTHPAHYNFGKYEVKDVIRDWKLGFSLGNACKYIARAGKKDPNKTIEDLEKAVFYIQDEITSLKNEKIKDLNRIKKSSEVFDEERVQRRSEFLATQYDSGRD